MRQVGSVMKNIGKIAMATAVVGTTAFLAAIVVAAWDEAQRCRPLPKDESRVSGDSGETNTFHTCS